MAMALATILVSFLLCSVAVHAADHVVGGNTGWTQGQDYSTWADGQTFRVGDNLVFNYALNHNVNEVDKNGYDNCDASNASPRTGGSTTIPLTSAGSKYYICSISNHCSASGMKLVVTVQAAATPGTPPPSGTPRSPPASPNTPPSPATPNTPPSTSPPATGGGSPSPPPPAGAAAGSFGSINSLLVGFSLVLATMFAFMG